MVSIATVDVKVNLSIVSVAHHLVVHVSTIKTARVKEKEEPKQIN